jgi:hypothetical protein
MHERPPDHSRPADHGDDRVDAALREMRAFVQATTVPDLEAGIMRQLHAPAGAASDSRPHRLVRLLSPLWAPRTITFTLRPAWGAAALVAMLAFMTQAGALVPAPTRSSTPAEEAPLFVQFRLQADQATDVRLAGTFTGWEPRVNLHETAPGVWSILLPLSAGVHDYAFMIDGVRWIPDPHAPGVSDGFGGTNSRLTLLPPDRRPQS